MGAVRAQPIHSPRRRPTRRRTAPRAGWPQDFHLVPLLSVATTESEEAPRIANRRKIGTTRRSCAARLPGASLLPSFHAASIAVISCCSEFATISQAVAPSEDKPAQGTYAGLDEVDFHIGLHSGAGTTKETQRSQSGLPLKANDHLIINLIWP